MLHKLLQISHHARCEIATEQKHVVWNIQDWANRVTQRVECAFVQWLFDKMLRFCAFHEHKIRIFRIVHAKLLPLSAVTHHFNLRLIRVRAHNLHSQLVRIAGMKLFELTWISTSVGFVQERLHAELGTLHGFYLVRELFDETHVRQQSPHRVGILCQRRAGWTNCGFVHVRIELWYYDAHDKLSDLVHEIYNVVDKPLKWA